MAISVLRLSGRRSTVRPSRSFRSQMIAHRRHKGGRRQHADPRDPDQTLGGVLIAYPFGELIVKPFDPTIDASPLLTHVLNEPPKAWSKTIALVRQYCRQIPRELASTLWYSDATLQHECTQLINERCPLRDQAPADAMQ